MLTLAIYQALLFVTSPGLAYAMTWLAGILFVMVFYPSHVFVEGRNSLTDRVVLGLSYAAVFFCGLAFLKMLTRAGISPRFSIFLVLIVNIAANFVAGRLLLRRG